MAFLRTNYRKTQFLAVARATVMVESTISYLAINFASLDYPPPKTLTELDYRLYALGNPTNSIIALKGSVDGNNFYVTLWMSETLGGAWDSTFSIAGIYKWTIGSR